MRCPFCRALDTKVVDSRLVGEGEQIRRRRECLDCEARFTTYENVELSLPRLIKQDGRVVSFQEQKLRLGFLRAVEKRPVDSGRIDRAIKNITQRLRSSGEREITTKRLGEWVMQELQLIDWVAYVRFASVYRRFEDVQDFTQEVKNLCNYEEFEEKEN